jgi:hypothetical protein
MRHNAGEENDIQLQPNAMLLELSLGPRKRHSVVDG